MAAMRIQSVRFSEPQWDLICREAERLDLSASQFIRDASFGLAVWLLAQRTPTAFEGRAAELRDLIADLHGLSE